MKALVSEVDSGPRVTEAARLPPELRAAPGLAFDLTTCKQDGLPWDVVEPESREEAERLLDAHEPTLRYLTPMCTACSA